MYNNNRNKDLKGFYINKKTKEKKMNKKEFVAAYKERTGIETMAEAERKVDAFLGLVEEKLVTGEEINFVGWGKWEVVDKSAKTGRNPKTGEEIQIPAKKAVKFKAGKSFADKVNG